MDYADTGFLVSLYLQEATTAAAEAAIARLMQPLPITPLLRLEIRNAFNFAVNRKRINAAQCATYLHIFAAGFASGTFVEVAPSSTDIYLKAMILSDRYTPKLATRSLDLLHVAAALLLGAKVFYSFDERQRQAAKGEGLKVKP